jgi:hypothetical protein
VEYKLEGYNLFMEMMAQIRRNVIYNVSRGGGGGGGGGGVFREVWVFVVRWGARGRFYVGLLRKH